jgi:hypothetical protein
MAEEIVAVKLEKEKGSPHWIFHDLPPKAGGHSEGSVRTATGYLYVKPYVGDYWFLTSTSYGKPLEDMKAFWEWMEKVKEYKGVADLLENLVGKKVKITVEVLE